MADGASDEGSEHPIPEVHSSSAVEKRRGDTCGSFILQRMVEIVSHAQSATVHTWIQLNSLVAESTKFYI